MSGTTAATSPVAEIEPVATVAAPEAAPEAAPIDANPAAPSPADEQDAKKPLSLLDVTRSVLEPKPEPEPEASSAPKEGDPVEAKAEDNAAEAVEPKAEDDADLPFHNHPRWKAVLAERDSLKDPAERYGMIQGFMREHGLTNEEVAEGYQVMALLKSGDPESLSKAREYFYENLMALDRSLGNVLPEDLQARVDEGLLDEDGAQELARSRAQIKLREVQDETRTEAQKAEQARRDAEAVQTALVNAVETWERQVKSSDPDYAKKADLVQAKVQVIVARTGKAPTNPDEAKAVCDQALSEVNALFKAALPKPRAISPAPVGSSAPAVVTPKTPRDITEFALAR